MNSAKGRAARRACSEDNQSRTIGFSKLPNRDGTCSSSRIVLPPCKKFSQRVSNSFTTQGVISPFDIDGGFFRLLCKAVASFWFCIFFNWRHEQSSGNESTEDDI